MISRPFWQRRIEDAWAEAPIVWFCGVRRSGKTTLAETLGSERVLYLNCDLPTVEDMVRDPQVFYRNYLLSPAGTPAYTKRFGSHEVRVCTPSELRGPNRL